MKVDPRARDRRDAHPVRAGLARVLGIHTDGRGQPGHANGERATAGWLGRLPEDWYVFRDVPVGERGATIDDVVIGPPGVFTVSTETLTGTLLVGARTILHDGRPTGLLAKATAEARRASRLLSAAIGRPVPVRGVLAILADEWTILEEPADVLVRGPRGAKNLMLMQPATLSLRAVRELVAVAAEPATWSTRREPQPGRCPCGGHMIPRVGRSDGRTFLGCSRFPRCRRTRPA